LGRPDASVGESGRGEVVVGEGREPLLEHPGQTSLARAFALQIETTTAEPPFVAARSPCSTTPRRDSYEHRRPDETLLYQLIEEHWPTFLERAEQSRGLPDFIVEEFEAYLRCGTAGNPRCAVNHVSIAGWKKSKKPGKWTMPAGS
jgi:hypothetical protein